MPCVGRRRTSQISATWKNHTIRKTGRSGNPGNGDCFVLLSTSRTAPFCLALALRPRPRCIKMAYHGSARSSECLGGCLRLSRWTLSRHIWDRVGVKRNVFQTDPAKLPLPKFGANHQGLDCRARLFGHSSERLPQGHALCLEFSIPRPRCAVRVIQRVL